LNPELLLRYIEVTPSAVLLAIGTYVRGCDMKGEIAERWKILCAQAAEEQDSEKLLELVKEINRLLEEKEQRLKNQDAERRAAFPSNKFLK
jgi:hypothetical protein